MKQTFLFLASGLFLLSSCNNSLPDEYSNSSSEKDKFITLSLGGEFISSSEKPLQSAPMEFTRSSFATGKTLYAVNVTCSSMPYAYGLFDDPSKMKLAIAKDNSSPFLFEVTAVTEEGDKLYREGTAYAEPFLMSDESTLPEVTNRFVPNKMIQFKDLKHGDTMVEGQETIVSHPRMDRFYAQTNYKNAGNVGKTINIDLKRAVFGLKFNIIPPQKGTATVKFLDHTISVSADDPTNYSEEHIYTFADVHAAATADEASGAAYEEIVPLEIKWTGGTNPQGVTKQESITAKRKTMTTLNIDFSSASDFTINLTLEEKVMKQESQDITVTE